VWLVLFSGLAACLACHRRDRGSSCGHTNR
jgi:hypothetical protein